MGLGTLALISGIAAGSSALLGAGQMIAGAQKTRDANKAADRALKDLKKIQTTNKLLALQVPTMGAEFQERALARGTAGQVEAMQEAGAAGVIGGAGRLTQAVGEQAGAQAAEINRMQAERDKLVLGQEQAIETAQQDVLRNIEGMRLQGAQAASAEGAAMQQAGAQSIASGIGLGAEIFASGLNPYKNQKTTTTGKKGVPKGTTTGIDPNTGKMVSLAPGYPGAQVITRPAVTSGLTSTQPQLRDPYGASFNPAISPGSFGPMATGVYSEDIYGLQAPLTQSPSSFIFNPNY
jgi:hypothetical protein